MENLDFFAKKLNILHFLYINILSFTFSVGSTVLTFLLLQFFPYLYFRAIFLADFKKFVLKIPFFCNLNYYFSYFLDLLSF